MTVQRTVHTTRTTIDVSTETWRQLKHVALDRDLLLSTLVDQILTEYVKREITQK